MKIRSFRFQLVALTMLVIIAAFCVVNELVTGYFLSALWERDFQATQSQFAIVERQISDLLSKARQEAAAVWRKGVIQDFLLRPSDTDRQKILRNIALIEQMRGAIAEGGTLSGLLVYLDGGVYGVTPSFNIRRAQDAVFDLELNQRALLPESNALHWIGFYPLQSLVNIRLTDPALLGQQYLIGLSRTRLSMGSRSQAVDFTTAVLISSEKIADLYAHMQSAKVTIGIVDASGRAISGDMAELPDFPDAYGQMDWQNESGNYRLFYYRLRDLNGVLVRLTDINAYHAQTRALRVHSYLLSALVAAATAALFILLTGACFRPFRLINSVFRTVRNGNLSVRLQPFARKIIPVAEEMQIMRVQLNRMLDSIEALVGQTQRMERERTELECRALQAQLNPHMIFHTVSSIRWMVMLQQDNWPGSERVNTMLIEFAALLEPLFEESRTEWTLEEELNYVRHYVSLLQMRCGVSFEIQGDIPPAVLRTPLPRFILQPILENSCEHGAVDRQSIRIWLEVFQADGFLFLAVSDNGRGMSEESLRKLSAHIEEGEAQPGGTPLGHSGIGLMNVHRRLRSRYGADSGLSVESHPEQGVRVTIKFPFPKKVLETH